MSVINTEEADWLWGWQLVVRSTGGRFYTAVAATGVFLDDVQVRSRQMNTNWNHMNSFSDLFFFFFFEKLLLGYQRRQFVSRASRLTAVVVVNLVWSALTVVLSVFPANLASVLSACWKQQVLMSH